MPAAPEPSDEPARLRELQSFGILNTRSEQSYQDIVDRLAADCDVPIAAISLIDARRQWFKASVGLGERETPRNAAICAYSILSDEPLVVEDATMDPRFADNPLVVGAPFIRSYAGVPLVSNGGHRIGALCAIDTRPRRFAPTIVQRLRWLAGRTMILLHVQKAVEQARFEDARRLHVD